MVSDGDRDLWPDGILSPQIADFRLHCAESKVKPKMAETSGPDTFLEGVKYGLENVEKANITLKQKQEEILKIIALTQKDVLAVLPTGDGKSLIYQIMPPLMDYMDSGQRPTQNKSIVLVVSPLNALIRDQVTKLKQSGLKAGGVRTTTAMHCGFKIFKMAAKVEKFRRLYALFFNRYSSFLR